MKRGPTVPPAVRWGSIGSRRGLGGPGGLPDGPVLVRTSIVHRYGTVERPFEPCQVPSCQNRVPTETRWKPMWPDGTRRAPTDHSTVPYWCTTDIRTQRGHQSLTPDKV